MVVVIKISTQSMIRSLLPMLSRFEDGYDDELEDIKDDHDTNFVDDPQDIRLYLAGNQVLVQDYLAIPEHFRLISL